MPGFAAPDMRNSFADILISDGVYGFGEDTVIIASEYNLQHLLNALRLGLYRSCDVNCANALCGPDGGA